MSAELPTVDEIAANAARLRERLAACGGHDVELLAVTKGFDVELCRRAVAAGLVDLGENYAQELEAKSDVLAAEGLDVGWEFIGRLQRNKVRRLGAAVRRWDSVDRPSLIDEIARRVPGARILVQVNVSDEPTKGGCAPGDTAELVERGRAAGLAVEGLMTVGRTGDPDDARAGFATLRRLCDQLDVPVCSMGMSSDLEAAVAEGSTQVRVGTALFGPRPAR